MKLPSVILASNSPRRSELLKTLLVDFTIIPSDAEEAHNENLTATEICQLNAYRKARAVAKKHPDSLVLGADTLVYLDTKLFGKPSTRAEASRMLKKLQGQTHQVVTGVCLLHLRDHHQSIFAESTDVTFRRLNAKQIEGYLKQINPLDKAGGYAIQEHGDEIVEKISGSLSNVIGLPIEHLGEEFAAWTGSAKSAHATV